MKITVTSTGLIACLALALAGCGSDGGGNGGDAGGSGKGGSGASGSSGSGTGGGMSGSSGSASQAGTTAGGTGGTGSGGSASSDVCSPGTTTEGAFAYPKLIQNCGFEGTGELAGQDGLYRSIKLPNPIGPGDVFAFSVGIEKLGQGSMELWGGSGECGEAHELLATAEIPVGGGMAGWSRCMTVRPQVGTYPYLIWVMKTAGSHGDVTMCPDVACPGE